jgi:hypothetical protein
MLSSFTPEDHKQFYIDNIKDKDILIVGSGPSTNKVKWEKLKVDTVLTTSFFYLNDKIRTLPNIKHITLSNIINLKDPNLIEFIDSNKECSIGFEVNTHPFYKGSTYKDFVEKYEDRIISYWTKDHSNCLHIGVGGRLCFLAINFKPKNIYYVGIDGTSKNPNNDPDNAFRKERKMNHKTGYFNTHDNAGNWKEMIPGYLKMSEILFNYANENNIKIHNLGEGFDYNIATEHSYKHYPLSRDIKKIIK